MRPLQRSSMSETGGSVRGAAHVPAGVRTRWDVVALGVAAGVMVGWVIVSLPPSRR